jgi:hypothetical protein
MSICYQYGTGRSRKVLGDGRPPSKVVSRQLHFRDLLAGHGRRDDALRYARLRAPSANGRATSQCATRHRAHLDGSLALVPGDRRRVALSLPGSRRRTPSLRTSMGASGTSVSMTRCSPRSPRHAAPSPHGKEDYNRRRPHSALGNMTPAEFALKFMREKQAA